MHITCHFFEGFLDKLLLWGQRWVSWLPSELVVGFTFKRIERLLAGVLFEVEMKIIVPSGPVPSSLQFVQRLIGYLDSASRGCMRSRRLYNYRVFLECSEYRLLLSIFSNSALESLVNIFLAETMLHQSEKLKLTILES